MPARRHAPAGRAAVAAVLAVLGTAGPPGRARAQGTAELAELRALVRQQAQAMAAQQRTLQALQGRLASLEARSRAAATNLTPPTGNPALDQDALRTAEAGTPDVSRVRRRPQDQAQPVPQPAQAQPGVPAAGTGPQQAAGPPGRRSPDAPLGEAVGETPARSTQQGAPAAPAAGNPPFPVLSGNDRVQVTLSGQVNREVLVHGDGSGRVDAYFADNNVSTTRLRALASARLDDDTLAVSALEFDLRSNSSGQVTRQSSNNNGADTPALGTFRIRRAEAGVQSARFGSLLLGRGSTFADGIATLDLSGTDIAFYSYLGDQGGSLQLANRGKPYRRPGDPTLGQISDDFDGFRDDRIRYDSPAWNGLSAGGSVAQGLYYDVGLRYAAELGGAKVAAGLAYMDYSGTQPSTRREDGNQPAYTPFARRVAGSAAVLWPNGLNALVSAGWGRHHGDCCGAGIVVRDDSTTYYAKLGYQANLFPFGKTNFSVDGGQTRNRYRDGDVASRFGLQVNQPVIARGFEVFAAWERVLLRRVGERFQPTDLGVLGTRVQF